MFAVATVLALLIATAGWHYLFYSRAAERLAGVEEERLNRLRVRLRRAGGLVLLALGPTFFAGFRTLEPREDFDSARFVTLWLTVLGLMGLMVVLALVDVRLTIKLRRRQEMRTAAGGDA
jgi:O-antigen/teichoic acid export membrane protein